MGSLNSIVNVQITRQTSVPSRAGFGTGAFLANDTTLSDPTKSYASLTEMSDDPALAGSKALTAGGSYFGQQVSPTKLTVIRQDIANVSEIGSLIFSEDLIFSDLTTVTVDGVELAGVGWDTDLVTTLTAIAVEIAGVAEVASAVSNGVDGIDITFNDFVSHTVTAEITTTP